MNTSLLRIALPAFCLLAAQLPGQPATKQAAGPTYTQSLTYLKTAPGKGSDWLKMTREETMKVAQVRADAGEIVSWTLLRSVYPAGEEARADYVMRWLSTGLRTQTLERELDEESKISPRARGQDRSDRRDARCMTL